MVPALETDFPAKQGVCPSTSFVSHPPSPADYIPNNPWHDSSSSHEFHFSTQIDTQDESFPWAFEFTKMRNNMKYKAGYAKDNIVGSYLHLHFLGSKQNAKYFVEKIRAYKKSLEMEEN